jgi:glyoxylase-like metal-dependent hydrolase (beta-lactamase superfamily II)
MTTLSRRTMLAGAATVGAAAISSLNLTSPVKAAAPQFGKTGSGFYRRKLGDLEVTTILDEILVRDVTASMVRNAELADVQKEVTVTSPDGKIRQPYAPLVVNNGSKLVVLDTGNGTRLGPNLGQYAENFAAAGLDTKNVDIVLISHFHPDHINGIRLKDESLAFPNAEIQVPAPEWAFWMSDENMAKAPEAGRGTFMNVRRVFKDLGDRIKQYQPGKEIVTGITTVATPGHTPGHTSFLLSSGKESLFMVVDAATIELFVRKPNWHLGFDSIPALAEETRKKMLDMVVTDRMLATGYHWPFPGISYVAKDGEGYRLYSAT